MNTTRRELLRSAALLTGTVLFARGLVACSSDAGADEPLDESGEALVTCKPPVISANHGHRLVVSPADVAAGVDKTYSIAGTAGHDHQVTLTAAEFAVLGAGHAITVTSTNGAGHTHDVTVTCSVSSPATCGRGATATAISANHGHSLRVPKGDIATAATKTYSIKGTATHVHQVTITAPQFAQLKAGQSITVTSSAALAHVHTVTVACA